MNAKRIDPTTVEFDLQDAITKLMRLHGLTQRDIAARVEKRESTVSEFLNRQVNTSDGVIDAILTQLQTNRAEVDALVSRMNGKAYARRIPDERAEDRDPRLRNAIQLGRDIAALPNDAQNVIYHLVRVFEMAYRDRPR